MGKPSCVNGVGLLMGPSTSEEESIRNAVLELFDGGAAGGRAILFLWLLWLG